MKLEMKRNEIKPCETSYVKNWKYSKASKRE